MRRCAICGLEENKEIPKTEHQFVQEEDRTIMPTCEQDGTKFYICSICHEEYIESIPALGHDWSFWSTVREANCHEEGLKERYCMRSGCGAKESDLIAKTSHLWGEWEIAKVATCVAGEKQRMCSICGDVEKQVIPMDPSAGHVWTEWQVTKTPSCSKGQEKRVCQNCGIEEFRDIPATLDSEHIWGEPMVVEDIYDADGVTLLKAGYKMIQCSVCGTMRLEMETAKATLDPILTKDGDVLYKDNEPVMSKFKIETANSADNEDEKINVGVKLDKYSGFSSSDNAAYHGSFSFKFDFDREADVAIYQRGCMDSFSGNKQRTYYSGADMDNYTYANFEFDVNGEPIDLYEQRNVRYCDVVEERDPYDYNDPLRNSGYSTFGEFYIGESQIVAGENTFTYKRLASYNLVTTYIILEVSFPDHIHEAERDAEWVNTDSDYHWKNCKEGDGYKLGKARHDFGEAYIEIEPICTCDGLAHKMCKVCGYSYDIVVPALGHDFGEIIVDVAPTCTEKGFGHRICKRCESIVDEEIATTGHNWDEGTTIYNSEGKAVIPLTCSCGKVGAKMAVSDYSSASFTSTTGTDGDIQYKFDKNSDNVWKINAPKAGTYEIRVSAKIDASNKNHTLSDSPVTVKVGNISYEVSTATFAELGVGTSKIAEFVLVPEAYFEEGENTITISQGSGGYRLTYGGDIVICEI